MAEDWWLGVDDMGLYAFFLTFGIAYAREPHPAGSWIHPDGWVIICAATYHEARTVAVDLFGRNWSDLYHPDLFDPYQRVYEGGPLLFPRGELLRIVVPTGLVETEDHR